MQLFELPKIIGICGKKFSGKSTVGLYLEDEYNYKQIAFADALKDICKIIFGLTTEQLNGDLKETVDEYWNTTPRKILQFVGTDLFKNRIGELLPHIGSTIWIEIVKRNILQEWNTHPNTKFVITDIRFVDEIDFIHNIGGKVIKITRPSTHIDTHVSEVNINNLCCDYNINNKYSLEYLYSSIDDILL